MLKLLVVMSLVLAGTAAKAVEFKPARLLEAEAYTERQTTAAVIKGNGGIYSIKHDMNRIAVALDGMKVTAVYEAHWSWSPKASSLVIGTDVQAKMDNDKLVVLTPEGKTIKARIVRRELQAQPVPTSDTTSAETMSNLGARQKPENTNDITGNEE